MAKKKKRKGSKTTIGGVNIEGISGGELNIGDISANVTAGGDIVGGDKNTVFNQTGQKVGKQYNIDGDYHNKSHNITAGDRAVINSKADGNIITGDNNRVITGDNNQIDVNTNNIDHHFAPVYEKIESSGLSKYDKDDLKDEVEKIKKYIEEQKEKNVDDIDDTFLSRRLRNIKSMSPDILDVIAASWLNPVAGLAVVGSKIRAKVQEMSAT